MFSTNARLFLVPTVLLVVVPLIYAADPSTLLTMSSPDQNQTSPVTFPNLYPIPNTPYSIRFEPARLPLNREDVLNCIIRARAKIADSIKTHGDLPIPGGLSPLVHEYRTVAFEIEPVKSRGGRDLSYQDTLAILSAYSAKMTEEGYREHSTRIIMTQGKQRVGKAFLGLAEEKERKVQLTFPNPYPMEGTPFSLDFRPEHVTIPLDSAAATTCILTLRQKAIEHIQKKGDSPISGLGFNIRNVEFDISSDMQHAGGPLLYRDFVAVLSGFLMKMLREGFQSRYAEIILTEGGEFVGSAQIYPEDEDASSKEGSDSSPSSSA